MVSVVFFVAALNLGLGFALAILFESRRRASRPAAPPEATRPAPRAAAPRPDETGAAPLTLPMGPAEEIPGEWLEVLESHELASNSFVEAALQVLRLEVGHYRQQLVELEQRVRQGLADASVPMDPQLLVDFDELNRKWLRQQGGAADQLHVRHGTLGAYEQVAGLLHDVLRAQAERIESSCRVASQLDVHASPVSSCGRMIIEIGKLADLAHALRDRMIDSIVAIWRVEKRLGSIDVKHQFDSLTGLHNRVGLETIFHDWWRDDVARGRLVSVVILDIDHFARINRQFGTKTSDKIIAEFGKLLAGVIRKDRGFDRVARIAGETFALFLGDTGPRNAMSAAERIRQTMEESSFHVGHEELRLTISCAVTEVLRDDNTATLLKRLRKTLQQAKVTGRNRTFIDEGEGPNGVDPPKYQVRPQLVHIAEDLPASRFG